MRISDWSSDVCSSDLPRGVLFTVMLDPTTGEYTVTLEDNVLHADDGTDTENDATTDITFTAIDSEGDPTDATLTVTFDADVPTATDEIGRASCRERGCQDG